MVESLGFGSGEVPRVSLHARWRLCAQNIELLAFGLKVYTLLPARRSCRSFFEREPRRVNKIRLRPVERVARASFCVTLVDSLLPETALILMVVFPRDNGLFHSLRL